MNALVAVLGKLSAKCVNLTIFCTTGVHDIIGDHLCNQVHTHFLDLSKSTLFIACVYR